MVRIVSAVCLFAAIGAISFSAFGQTAATDVNPAAAIPAAQPLAKPPAPPSPPPAAIQAVASPSIAAMLSVDLPKYDPPKPAPPPKPEDETAAADKPKNGIVRLPQYIVRAARPPVFREWDLYSKDGLARLALQRYQGLSIVPFSSMNKDIALQMYGDDQRLQNMAILNDDAQTMQRGGDTAGSDYIKKMSQDTYMRGIDWGGPVQGNPSGLDLDASLQR
jgi:hypothetical protein